VPVLLRHPEEGKAIGARGREGMREHFLLHDSSPMRCGSMEPCSTRNTEQANQRMKGRLPMSAARAALLGAALGGVSGGVVGGGIAQFFAGPDSPVLPLYIAAFVGAIVSGILSGLAIRNSLCKAPSR
jgi:hypothetical protein